MSQSVEVSDADLAGLAETLACLLAVTYRERTAAWPVLLYTTHVLESVTFAMDCEEHVHVLDLSKLRERGLLVG